VSEVNFFPHTSNKKAPGATNTEGLSTNAINERNSAIGFAKSKAIATQIAELAIAGHAVHQIADGGFLVCKYGYTYHALDFEALQNFARKLGVKQ
jgi:hypothetical protein